MQEVYRIIMTAVVSADNEADALRRQLLRGNRFERIEIQTVKPNEVLDDKSQ